MNDQRHSTRRIRHALRPAAVGLLALILAGCGLGGAQIDDPVIVVATPIPPDANFVTYEHPSGVFTLRVPPDWIAGELPDANGIRVQFTTLEDSDAVTRLSAYVVNTGQPMTPEAFAQAANAYQPPDDLAGYNWSEIDRTAQRDGSRRIAGVRTYPTLGPRDINIFLQGDGAFFSALEIDITDASSAMIDTLRVVVNTFQVNQNAELAVGTVQQAAAGVTSYSGVIGFQGYTTWTDRQGVFHITGEVVNTTLAPLEAMRISGVLLDAQSRRLAEQSDILSVDVLAPGQSAPFDLRFEGGKPPPTVRYELGVAGREAEYALTEFYGPDNFVIANDEAIYNDQRNLVIRGELANVGSEIAESVKVVVAIWDDQGQVVATETVFLSKPQLVPQEAAPFEVPFYELGGPAVTYTLTITGTRGTPPES
jgi:hypothetical protein